MALSGTFLADFSAFDAACKNSELSLKSFETGAGKVETALNKAGNAFSGQRTIQEATLMATAIDKIGGTSSLTASELSKAGSKASEAVEKMKALGIEVPPQLQKLADSTHVTIGSFLSGIPIIGQFVAAFTVEKLVEFAKATVNAAGTIDDLALATGLSREEVQKFAYVGSEFGLGMDEMARGVSNLSQRLANNDTSAVSAVQRLGFSVKELMAEGPARSFIDVAEAVGRIEDPMLKNGLAADLFGGKLGRVLIPALAELRAKLNEVPKNAIADEESVKAADRFDDAIGHLVIRTKALAVEMVALPIHIFDAYKTVLAGVTEEQLQAEHGARGFFASQINVNSSVDEGTQKAELMKNAMKAWRTEGQEPLSDAQREAIDLGVKLGKNEGDIAKAISVSTAAVHQYTEGLKKQEESLERLNKAQIDEVEGWQKIQVALRAMVPSMKEVEAQTLSLTAAGGRLVNEVLLKELDAQLRLNLANGEQAPSALQKYQTALDLLHATKGDGITQSAREHELFAQLLKDLEAEAAGNDKAREALKKKNDEKDRELQQFTLSSMFSLDPNNPNSMAARAAAVGGQIAYDSYNNPYIWIPGVNAPPPSTRDSGGSVSAGQPYYVGTGVQPELFVPSTSGSMFPRGAGGVTIVNHNYITQPFGTPDQIGDAIVAAFRAKGGRIPMVA